MNHPSENIHDELPEDLRKILDTGKTEVEFLVPVDYFEELKGQILLNALKVQENEKEFLTPQNYFEDLGQQVLASSIQESEEATTIFFARQEQQILSQIEILSSSEIEDELKVPNDFFNKQYAEIAGKLDNKEKEGKVIVLRRKMLMYAAVAAVVIVGLFFFLPKQNHRDKPSFAEVLNGSFLDEDDMEYFASDDDYYELYFHSSEELAIDTISTDTLQIDEMNEDKELPENLNEPVKLDPRTGLPIKQSNGIKPLEGEVAPSWDDISDEDLMKYLMEEGDDELLNELN